MYTWTKSRQGKKINKSYLSPFWPERSPTVSVIHPAMASLPGALRCKSCADRVWNQFRVTSSAGRSSVSLLGFYRTLPAHCWSQTSMTMHTACQILRGMQDKVGLYADGLSKTGISSDPDMVNSSGIHQLFWLRAEKISSSDFFSFCQQTANESSKMVILTCSTWLWCNMCASKTQATSAVA